MIDKCDSDFALFSRDSEPPNVTPSGLIESHMSNFCQNVENDYLKIQSDLSIQLDDLKLISAILSLNSREANNGCSNDSLTLATNKAIHKIRDFAFLELRESLVHFYLKNADWLLGQGRLEEAFHCWEQVLSVNPDNQYIHMKLLDQANAPESIKERAERLHATYRFKYLGSFGQAVLRGPIAIIAADHRNAIYVSDNVGNRIHKFNTGGEYLGTLPEEIENSRGLFKDSEGNVWICDFGNSRLLTVDSNDNIVNEISLHQILKGNFSTTLPVFGCLEGDRLYLLLVDGSYQQRALISFDRHDPYNSLDILPTHGIQTPNFFGFYDHELYLCDWEQCDLFMFDRAQRCFKPMGWNGIPHPLRWFVNFDGSLFLTAGTYILKILSNGQTVFRANLSNIFGLQRTLPLDLAILRNKTTHQLFVTDYSLACIHRFAI